MNFLKRREGRAHPLDLFRRDMDQLFNDFFTGRSLFRGENGMGIPAVDVSETDAEVHVQAELPGVLPEEVTITAEEDTLVLKGEKKVERESKEKQWHVIERSYGSFSRVVPLPASVDSAEAKASYKDGVLEITLPKKPEKQARKVEIKVDK
jgi:HSP20 family protein